MIGKPGVYGLETILRDHHSYDEINKEDIKKRFLMIGDNLLTDILLGKNGNIDCALMLTGVTNI